MELLFARHFERYYNSVGPVLHKNKLSGQKYLALQLN